MSLRGARFEGLIGGDTVKLYIKVYRFLLSFGHDL